MSGERIRVALVDDQALFRAGIRMLVSSQPDMEFVGEAGDGREACELAAEVAPDLILMDVRMPVMDGIEATGRILAEAERGSRRVPRIIVLTTFDLDEAAARAIRAGASGFLLKDAEPEFLLASLRTVHAGNAVIAANATRELLARFMPGRPVEAGGDGDAGGRGSEPGPSGRPAGSPRPAGGQSVPARAAASFATLTAREKEIFLLAARGLSNAEIASTEFLSEATVKTHVSRILTKLELRDRVQLVVYAFENGLID